MLLTFNASGHTFTLARTQGLEQLYVDDKPVSVRKIPGDNTEHRFALAGKEWQLQLSLEQGLYRFALSADGVTQQQGQAPLPDDLDQRPVPPIDPAETGHGKGFGWLALGLKLFKSVSAIKVALAGASFASYAYLFDWKIALALIAILVFHEYGHLKAMHRFHIPTKGIYLIPFFGGAAVSAEQFKTQWQEVYVALAGPSFGLLLCLVTGALYWLTGIPWLGAVLTLGAFLNLFNLLPIHPLDGGRVLKAAMASTQKKAAFYAVLAFSALGFALSLYFGLLLLSILLVAGVMDLLGERKAPSSQAPMDKWAMVVSAAWYLAVLLPLLGILMVMADSGLPGTEIPHLILSS
ncbi:metalloprotease [Gallaecimonas xiamenensis]|uniref:Zn-dependent protease n=1 Tax=Gallaecimonas xiamenensis 3-C-1 TaxID=745411 RepID=K2IYF4_9GAMM|nr:site-2 protease family protein [Gallaecimonas xiamenensis]EKE67928.1 Zn-dependent protease [Gallaecimonas xiamenensis 3-C-1]